MRSSIFRSAFAAAALAFGVAGANADTATGTLSVTANVVTSCNLSAGSSPVAFGPVISGYSQAVNANGSITVNCGGAVNYTVGLDNGGNYNAGTSMRQMALGSNFVPYQLYRSDADRTAGSPTWGSTVNTLAGTGTGGAQTITVYGQIPANQTLTLGNGYTDTVKITVSY